jgi:hypothetical protein
LGDKVNNLLIFTIRKKFNIKNFNFSLMYINNIIIF